MASKPNIIVVLTSQAMNPTNRHKTGWYLPELAHFHNATKDKATLTIATPKGGEAPLDPSSVTLTTAHGDGDDRISTTFLNEHKPLWTNTLKLAQLVGRLSEFDAICYLGGIGPMFDLPSDTISLAILQTLASNKKPIASISHGSAAFLNATCPSGTPLIQGSTVTGYSDEEEGRMGTADALPFSLEVELNRVSGGGYVKGEGEGERGAGGKVVVGRTGMGGVLITGQNLGDSGGVAGELLRACGR